MAIGVSEQELSNRLMLKARDVMDRSFREELDVRALASAMFLLRDTDSSVTEICMDVGFSSLGTFSRTFTDIVGETPSAYRTRGAFPYVPGCFVKSWVRPSSFGEAPKTVDS
jgi:AraC-like DNA-binding protein